MSQHPKILGTDEAWDTRELGADESHVKVADEINRQLDDALELQPISIRLQKNLIDNLKNIGQLNGIGYQTLIRQILTRFVDSELRQLLNEEARQARLPKAPKQKAA